MKQTTDNDLVTCTYSYEGIPYLHATRKGELYRAACQHRGRLLKPMKITVTANGCSKRIRHLGKVYYFSELRKRAFKQVMTINLTRDYCDDSLPF